jgi:tRNA pseudouridine32 synthase/23S rRNA pseudouridine746 synthase
LSKQFTFLDGDKPHPLCKIAAEQVQDYLINQKDWIHNFGLNASQKGTVIGKMFGVLVVKNHRNETGYLAAFSGKLGGANHHAKFVPPVFDSLTENNFLNRGMAELNQMNQVISEENEYKLQGYLDRISILKIRRRKLSNNLQQELFNNYHFLNQHGEEKSLNELFPKSEQWKHGHYYPCCKEKCEPILVHMLDGIA